MAISFVGAAVTFRLIYSFRPEGFGSNIGLLNGIRSAFGQQPVAWLSESPWNNLLLMVIMIWIQVGFAMVVLSAAIKSIPEEIIEAARIDGANEFQVFWRIVVPSIAPTIVVVSTYMVINSLKVFDIVFVMGNAEANNTEVIAERMIRWFFIANNDGRGAAIAVVLFVAVDAGAGRGTSGGSASRRRSGEPRSRRSRRARTASSRPGKPPDGGAVGVKRRLVRPHHDHRRRRHLADPDRRCAGHLVPTRAPRRHDRMVDGARPSVARRRVDARELPGACSTPAGLQNAFLNSLAVTIPATVIPITIAAFAAYAFSWMEFRGRYVLFVVVVGLLVVPLQMALIPILRLYTGGVARRGVHIIPDLNLNGTFLGVWLAHTGFGLPLADVPAYATTSGRCRRRSSSRPGSTAPTTSRSSGGSIVPLSVPALAAFAIFQFLWVWNDLLVAYVFLGGTPDTGC